MVLSPDMVAIVVFSASVIGGVARAMLPYLRKLKEAEDSGETLPFEKKYVFTAVLAIVTSTIVGVLLFPNIIANVPQEALAGVFVYGFIAGWGATSLFNEVMSTAVGTTTTTIKREEPTPAPS